MQGDWSCLALRLHESIGSQTDIDKYSYKHATVQNVSWADQSKVFESAYDYREFVVLNA